ncbi:MAG: DUF2155 domain-containing protein [Rickettsiales bacterium]|nr:DUF2155 domain-containing protein [Rickettsiales bacterium]
MFFLLSATARAAEIAPISVIEPAENDQLTIKEENIIKNQPANRFANTAQIKVLNKVTGKSFSLEGKIGEKITVENLDIELLKCWKSYPEETPENKLLLKVYEEGSGYLDRNNLVFFGWIFSSSPSLNGLEHPFYDLTLENCKNII